MTSEHMPRSYIAVNANGVGCSHRHKKLRRAMDCALDRSTAQGRVVGYYRDGTSAVLFTIDDGGACFVGEGADIYNREEDGQ